MKDEVTTRPTDSIEITGTSEADALKEGEDNGVEPNPQESGEGGSAKYDPEENEESEQKETEPEPLESEEDYKLQPMFVCCCGSSFQFLGQITSHKKKNCEWIFVCPHCDRVYKDFDKLSEHKKIHQKPVPEPVPAPVSQPESASPATIEVKVKAQEEGDSKDGVEQKQESAGEEIISENEAKPVVKDSKDVKANVDNGPKKIELAPAQNKSKIQIKPVEKKIPPHIRAFKISGNYMGNQMRPNMMQNQGMMTPQQNFMGGFNQGMNYGMGMQPMMNMGMGNFGPMNPGMNMGNFGGFNMPNNQFCGPNMGMNMAMNMGGPNMGPMNNMGMNMGMNMGGPGMNMGQNMGPMNMGGMNMGMNMGNNTAPNMVGMNNPSNMVAPNIGGMNNTPNMGGMNMGNTPPVTQGGFNPTPGGNKPFGSKDILLGGNRGLKGDMGRDAKMDSIRGRSLSPRRGEGSRSSLGGSPPRRGLDTERDKFRDREYRDRFDYRDDDPIDRLGLADRKSFRDSRDRYSPSDRDHSGRSWPKRSMSKEEFLSGSSSSFFSKSSSGIGGFSKSESLYDRNYSPRDDGPPGLGKLGYGGILKRDNQDPLIMSRPAKIMRSSEFH